MTDKKLTKPVMKRTKSLNPSVHTKYRREYYIELEDYYFELALQAKSKEEKQEALTSMREVHEKLTILIDNIMARKPKRKPLR
jgi:hypothetical protein